MMMKRKKSMQMVALMMAVASLIPCKAQEENISKQPTSYIVEGTLAGSAADGMEIVLYDTEKRQNLNKSVVTDGKFYFTGVADSAIECQVIVPKYQVEGYSGIFILENGHIRMNLKESAHAPQGTLLNDEFRRIFALEDSLKQANASEEVYKTYSYQVFQGHEDDAIGYALLRSRFFTYAGTDSEKRVLLESLGPNLKRTGHYKFRLSTCAPNPLIGQHYKEIKGTDANGETLALSAFIGKGNYVLIDMWASWCAPCKGEVPYLKHLHNQYKDCGLTIVGIFTWDKPENMAKAIEEEGMTWPQIIDTEKIAMEQYQVTGIPTLVLLSPEGRILEMDLKFRGENMVKTVEKYLTK